MSPAERALLRALGEHVVQHCLRCSEWVRATRSHLPWSGGPSPCPSCTPLREALAALECESSS